MASIDMIALTPHTQLYAQTPQTHMQGVNSRWPRMYETFSEDPHLVGVMGAAVITGIQNFTHDDGLRAAACAKHFIAYSATSTGQDQSPVLLDKRDVMNYYLTPYRHAVAAGVRTFMESYQEISGVPMVSSKEYLKVGARACVFTYIQHPPAPHIRQPTYANNPRTHQPPCDRTCSATSSASTASSSRTTARSTASTASTPSPRTTGRRCVRVLCVWWSGLARGLSYVDSIS